MMLVCKHPGLFNLFLAPTLFFLKVKFHQKSEIKNEHFKNQLVILECFNCYKLEMKIVKVVKSSIYFYFQLYVAKNMEGLLNIRPS
jgi:hypothetical protein